jgi:Trm5-related predicted tRNA methylase
MKTGTIKIDYSVFRDYDYEAKNIQEKLFKNIKIIRIILWDTYLIITCKSKFFKENNKEYIFSFHKEVKSDPLWIRPIKAFTICRVFGKRYSIIKEKIRIKCNIVSYEGIINE